MREKFQDLSLKRIVLKIMDIPEEKNSTVLYLISIDVTNSGTFIQVGILPPAFPSFLSSDVASTLN